MASYTFVTPYFEAVLQEGSDLDGQPVSLSSKMEPFFKEGFFSHMHSKYKDRYRRDFSEVLTRCAKFSDRFNSVTRDFSHLFTEYDKQIVLPTTCGLSFVPQMHFDPDNTGDVGSDDQLPFEDSLIDEMVGVYSKFVNSVDNTKLSLSLPRGKNAGYPALTPGRNRVLADTWLLLFSSFTSQRSKFGFKTLSDVSEFMYSIHGEPFLFMGERLQHSAKWRAGCSNGSWFSTRNLQPRVRAIYMSPKYMVSWNRIHTKRMLKALLMTPWHSQDRNTISRVFLTAKKRGFYPFAVDFSQFDKTAGGKRGLSVLKLIAKLTGANVDDLNHEFLTPIATAFHGKAYKRRNGPILCSGISTTTLVGNITADLVVFSFLKQFLKLNSISEVVSRRGVDFDYLDWGDDMVLFLPEKNMTELKKEFPAYCASLGFKIEEEPTAKYLGSNYDAGAFKGSFDHGYSMGRAMQQQFFPERVKVPLLALVGYIARLEVMGPKAEEFHRVMSKYWEFPRPYFPFSQRHSVLRSLLPDIQKVSDSIGGLDDVLNIFTHGVDDPDLFFLLGVQDEFSSMSADSYLDLSDPNRVLKEYLTDLPGSTQSEIKKFISGELSSYHKILGLLKIGFNYNFRHGDVIY